MPQLDLHGEDRIGARIKVKTFIEDNFKLENEEIAIIHGIGEGILKKEVTEFLKKEPKVKEYCLDIFNEGCTLVKLHRKIDFSGEKCYNITRNLKGGTDNV